MRAAAPAPRAGPLAPLPVLWRLGLRFAALGGRLGFTLLAATHMAPAEFGRFGIVATLSTTLTVLVGLEVYQITVRTLVQGREGPALDLVRRHHGAFAAGGAALFAVGGLALFAGLGWPPGVAVLGALVLGSEQVGLELTRMLVAEDRAGRSIEAAALRTGLWPIALGAAALAHLGPRQWSVEGVLAAWLACSLAANALAWPILPRFRPTRGSLAGLPGWLRASLRGSLPWIAPALAWRFLESGARLVPALVGGEAAGGRFVLVSTLASFGMVGAKSVIEPLFLVRLSGRDGAAHRRRFARLNALWLAVAAAGSALALAGLQAGAPALHVGMGDWAVLGLLVSGLAAATLSQVPHFALYAARRDGTIVRLSLGLLGVEAFSVPLTMWLGPVGTAAGLLLAGLGLLAGKLLAARRIEAGRLEAGVPGPATAGLSGVAGAPAMA